MELKANNIGSYLKEIRERKGIPLDEISKKTYINKHYLLAIERNDFYQIPGHVYVIGFLRLYSKVLGIDADELVRIYKQEYMLKESQEAYATIDETRTSKLTKILLATGLLLLVAAAVAAYFLFIYGI